MESSQLTTMSLEERRAFERHDFGSGVHSLPDNAPAAASAEGAAAATATGKRYVAAREPEEGCARASTRAATRSAVETEGARERARERACEGACEGACDSLPALAPDALAPDALHAGQRIEIFWEREGQWMPATVLSHTGGAEGSTKVEYIYPAFTAEADEQLRYSPTAENSVGVALPWRLPAPQPAPAARSVPAPAPVTTGRVSTATGKREVAKTEEEKRAEAEAWAAGTRVRIVKEGEHYGHLGTVQSRNSNGWVKVEMEDGSEINVRSHHCQHVEEPAAAAASQGGNDDSEEEDEEDDEDEEDEEDE